MLSLKNVSKSFKGLDVLKNLNVEFKSGLNYIVGPSGAGKSTLLRILTGMDKKYDGQVIFKGKNLKEFKESELNSYYYNTVGFIWQDFKLINHLSVEDNVKIVLELSDLSEMEKEVKVNIILEKLGIKALAKKKVSKLSGGQKQRVSIGRALVKDPDIIIADEPTGALDKKSSKIMIDILKSIAKERLVIVVTHDKSLIDEDSTVFLLKDKGIEKISTDKERVDKKTKEKLIKPKLSIRNSIYLGMKNFKGLTLKFVMTSIILMISSIFLTLNTSGTVMNEQENILGELIESRGSALRDISVYSNVFNASGTGGDEGKKQSLDIKQDVSEVLKKYSKDPRVEYLVPIQSLNDMNVSIDGLVENHKVENSNGAPYLKEVVEGRLPSGEKREVAVTKAFLEKANLNAKDVIGKKINLTGMGYDWSSGEPVEVRNKIEGLTIVGVTDSTVEYKDPTYGDIKYEIEDSFIYGLDVVKEIREKIKADGENISFTLRIKEVKDIMPIVEELNKEGITAMGDFESVRDILSINNSTKEQSSAITTIISALAVVTVLISVLINTILRKREFAILKVNGYSKRSLFNLNVVENMLIAIASVGLFILASPFINKLAYKFFNISLSGIEPMISGVILILLQGLFMGIVAGAIVWNLKTENSINKGER